MKTETTDIIADLPFYCEKDNFTGSLANISALLMKHIPRLNWVGFYLYDGQQLVLGPFQGAPACTKIALGRGVCGTAFQDKKSLLVPNVDEFPGHIVCDTKSRSELVVPLISRQKAYGVLDLDSPDLARFQSEDQIFFEHVVEIVMEHLDVSERKFL